MAVQELTGLHDALLRLHGEARTLGEHQVSYHALAAAMHAAESMRDSAALESIASLAREHAQWIERNDPGHPLSTQSAALRGHHSLFEQLAAMCAAVRARLRAENLKRK
jgi:hypothetical protein